jgi:hypothetical protein
MYPEAMTNSAMVSILGCNGTTTTFSAPCAASAVVISCAVRYVPSMTGITSSSFTCVGSRGGTQFHAGVSPGGGCGGGCAFSLLLLLMRLLLDNEGACSGVGAGEASSSSSAASSTSAR